MSCAAHTIGSLKILEGTCLGFTGTILSVYRKSYYIITAIGRSAITAAPVTGFALAFSMPVPSQAHLIGGDRAHIIHKPLTSTYGSCRRDYTKEMSAKGWIKPSKFTVSG